MVIQNCAECLVQSCQIKSKTGIGDDCPMNIEGLDSETRALYAQSENQTLYEASIKSMKLSFARMTRVMEVISYCKLNRYEKIGLAYCSGMLREGRVFNEVLKENGFKVSAVGCKLGGFSPEDLIISGEIKSGPHPMTGKPRAICNPIGQALLLNREKTEFNVLLGLCVGHDTLFFKHSEAPCTVVVVKDRMLNHNPVADLYFRQAADMVSIPVSKFP